MHCYMLFWVSQRLLDFVLGGNQTIWTGDVQGAWATSVGIGVLLGALSLTGSLRLLVALVALFAALTWAKAPMIWDCDFWCVETDLALLLAYLCQCGLTLDAPGGEARRRVYAHATELITAQMGLYYLAAAFWKLNSSFLSVRHSCAPIFLLQLLAAVVPDALPIPDGLAYLLGQSAPLLVLAGEASMAACLLQRRSARATKAGVALALFFHLTVAACPPPNNVAIFSALCASRLTLFLPTGVPAAVSELSRLVAAPRASALGIYYAVAAVAVAAAAQLASHPGFFDWGYPVYIAQAFVLCRALALEPDAASPAGDAPPPPTDTRRASPRAERVARRIIVAGTAFYAFGAIPLGVHDQGQPHMYANLRLHGGSNHYLVPTAVLQTLFEDADPRGRLGDFSGGVVRIESSTSSLLNAAYPAEYTDQLSERTRHFLRAANHTGRQWNPMLTLVADSPCPWLPESGAPFVKYTMPALELRRFLATLRDAREAFEIVYTRLPANEAARAATGRGTRTVTLREDGQGGRECTVREHDSPAALSAFWGKAPCGPDELALLPPPSYLARKLILFEPYPVIVGDDDEVHCFGP